MLDQQLKDLGEQFSALQQLGQRNPEQAREMLPGILAGLQQRLDALQVAVMGHAEDEPAASNALARAREMAERSPTLVRIMSTEARCQWANRAWADFTGRSLQQLLGEGWLEAVHPDDRGHCARICHDAFEASRLDCVEYRLQRKNGDYGWVLEIGIPRLNSHGNVGGYLGTAIEITGHRQAEKYLALQYALARALSEVDSLEAASARSLPILGKGLDFDVGELWSVDADERVPRCVHLWATPSIDVSGLEEGARTRVFPSGAGPPWQSGKPAWIADITLDETFAREPEAQHLGLHGMFRLPVSVHGEVRAILRFFCRAVRHVDQPLVEFMTAVGVQIGQVVERQRDVERIRESEARKAAILEASLDAVITIDHQGKVVEFNSAAETIFGYRRHDAVGRELSSLIVPPRLREQALSGFAAFRDTGGGRFLGKRFDAIAMKSNGSEFPVEVAIAPIKNGDHPMLTVFVCDATANKTAEQELKRYQAHLRSLMADLLLAEESERRRLAIDLHDGLSQTIALAQIKLSALRPSVDAKLTGSIDEIAGLIVQANRSARSISFELSPPVLHDLGLEPAVQWLVENIQARYGIEIVLEDDGRPKPTDERTRVILFRSIRELLINAAKHAGARRVHVYLGRDEDQLSAAVEDDGVGMEPEAVGKNGFGLVSIRERLSHVGGSMQLESAPGRGTKIRLCAPLAGTRPATKRVET